jgi:site-specific DNA-methyltransferase (adenine-specific)
MTGVLHIVVARKPIEGTIVENCLQWGCGALNIDGCRVDAEVGGRPLREVAAMRDDVQYRGNSLAGRVDGSLASSKAIGSTNLGRWPANLVLGGEEVASGFPDSKGQQGDVRGTEQSRAGSKGIYGIFNGVAISTKRGDSGSASRFFLNFAEQESDE